VILFICEKNSARCVTNRCDLGYMKEQAKRGDMVERDDIYGNYADFIYRYIMTLTHDSHAAEELTQETFYQAMKSLDSFDEGKSKLSTWLCAIARNVWLQEVNREKKRMRLTDRLKVEEAGFHHVEEELLKGEAKVEFFKRVRGLDEKKREILYLRLLGELSFKEIGTVFGESENWARVTFYRAKQEMRKGVKRDES
jgi:RNA polymerase sigma factor (sigma-70 family)